MINPWRIELLGRIRAVNGDTEVTRFESRKVAALLACLALAGGKALSRDEVIERLWPDVDPESGRNRLKQALSSLRRQLEPPHIPSGAVLIADRQTLRLNPDAAQSDVAEFEAELSLAKSSGNPSAETNHLSRADVVYSGDFMPGHYDDWVIEYRDRLAHEWRRSLSRLIRLLGNMGDSERASLAAARLTAADPLDEDAWILRIEATISAGHVEDARRCLAQAERIFREELGAEPGVELRALRMTIDQGGTASSKEDRAPRTTDSSAPPTVSTAPAQPGPEVSPVQLPLQFTRFFGREDEMDSIIRLFRSAADDELSQRLITFTGPGGAGKTRLAIETARKSAGEFGGGIWFIALADVVEETGIADAIRKNLGLIISDTAEAGGVLDMCMRFLNDRPAKTLLVLDNFEQLIPNGTDWVNTLLGGTTSTTVLVTSRSKLNLYGEREVTIAPLGTPEAGSGTLAAPSPDKLWTFPSVRMFVDRAQSARPDFQITNRNAAAVARLCERLEGMPLAIELAAAWAQVMTPSQMVERLEDNAFDAEILTSRRRDINSRHHSVRAVLNWSYNMLAPAIQSLFTSLSVFRGGFSIEAAERVASSSLNPIDKSIKPVANGLLELREWSLVISEEIDESTEAACDETMRFRLLETMRQYGQERLTLSESATLSKAHAEYFAAHAEFGDSHLHGPLQRNWLSRIGREHDNIRAALRWCCETPGYGDLAVRISAAMFGFWDIRGHIQEGLGWVEAALASAETRGKSYCTALTSAGVLAQKHGKGDLAVQYLKQALELARELGDDELIADALFGNGYACLCRFDYECSTRDHEEALKIRRGLNEPWKIAHSCNALAILYRRFYNDEAGAMHLYEEAMHISRSIEDRRGLSFQLCNLSNTAMEQGDHERARMLMEENLEICREMADPLGEAEALYSLATIAEDEAKHEYAYQLYLDSFERTSRLGDLKIASGALWGVADYAIKLRKGDAAACLLGATDAIRDRLGVPFPPHWRPQYEQTCKDARALLSSASFSAYYERGKSLSRDKMLALAIELGQQEGSQ